MGALIMIVADETTYGKLIWQYDPAEALAEARRRIALTMQDPSKTWLFFSDLSALRKLPDELSQCHQLKRLSLGDDKAPDGTIFH